MLELNKSKLREAARSIREHNRIHSRKEPQAVLITQYLEFAANLIEKIADGKISLAEERHGRWLSLKGWFNKSNVKYSVCGNTLNMDGVNAGRGDANFCPNCGADMREVSEDAEKD